MYSSANSTHSTITTVAKSVYDDFSVPTPFRSARVIVEGRSVYVNPGWLAEFSNFFATMFFGKSMDKDLTFGIEVSYEHFIELLRVLCYCPTRKPITNSTSCLINLISQLRTNFESLVTGVLRYTEQIYVPQHWHYWKDSICESWRAVVCKYFIHFIFFHHIFFTVRIASQTTVC
uniref:BTB domain-containing protein n=1 Tax=Elaeophora elaphi TaxID=1147741 RepID=A0A0R3RZD9_9BILA